MKVQKQITNDNYELVAANLANKVVIKGENIDYFTESALKMLKELGPQTEIEINMCEKYIFLNWKLWRLLEHERNILNEQNSRLDSKDETDIYFKRKSGRRVRNIKRIDLSDPRVINLTRQQYELEKRMNKILDRLRAEQSNRKQ